MSTRVKGNFQFRRISSDANNIGAVVKQIEVIITSFYAFPSFL